MRDYVLTLLVAAAVTYLLTPLARRIAIAVGALHAARKRDVHTDPVPLLGGLAMYGGLAAALLVAMRLPALHGAFSGTPRGAEGLLLSGGLLVVVGFIDDRWGLGVFGKLAGQVAAGAILIWSGVELYWLPKPGGGPSATLGLTPNEGVVITILVVVVTINAVNFIDGLDGLAAGIVGIGAAAFFVYYYYLLTRPLGLADQTAPALVSAVLTGACLGFLPHNFNPARIFMGDTGSMLIGLLLAYAPLYSLAYMNPGSLVVRTAYAHGTANRFGIFAPLLVPAAILLIPYADLLLAVVRRTRAGMSPFAADKKHLQHRLLEVGHSHRRSVLIMYLWAALFAGVVVWLSILQTPSLVLGGVTVAMFALLALLLFSMPRLRPWRRAAAAAARKAAPGPAAPGQSAADLAPSVGAAAGPAAGFLTAPLAAPGAAAAQASFPGRTPSATNSHTPRRAARDPGQPEPAPRVPSQPARAAEGDWSNGAAPSGEAPQSDTSQETHERAQGSPAWPASGTPGAAPLTAARPGPLSYATPDPVANPPGSFSRPAPDASLRMARGPFGGGEPGASGYPAPGPFGRAAGASAADPFGPAGPGAAGHPAASPFGGSAPPSHDRLAPPAAATFPGSERPGQDRLAPPAAATFPGSDWSLAPGHAAAERTFAGDPAKRFGAAAPAAQLPAGEPADPPSDPNPAAPLPGSQPESTPAWQRPRTPAVGSSPPWPPAQPPS